MTQSTDSWKWRNALSTIQIPFPWYNKICTWINQPLCSSELFGFIPNVLHANLLSI